MIEDKKQIRKRLEEIRSNIPANIYEETPGKCMNLLRSFPLYHETRVVYLFLSFRTEIDTISMIPYLLQDGKRVAVPRVEGKIMNFYEINSMEDCEAGSWGIPEPKKNCPLVLEAGIMLAPGLGFDLQGGRIGYGGGFYDRYLHEHKDIVKIGLCFQEQLLPLINMEVHDIRMDYILTQDQFSQVKRM